MWEMRSEVFSFNLKSTLPPCIAVSLLYPLILGIYKFAKRGCHNSQLKLYFFLAKMECFISMRHLFVNLIDTNCYFNWNTLPIAFDSSVSLIQYQLSELFWTWWRTGCLPSKYLGMVLHKCTQTSVFFLDSTLPHPHSFLLKNFTFVLHMGWTLLTNSIWIRTALHRVSTACLLVILSQFYR